MKKETKVLKEVIETQEFCDVCGVELSKQLRCDSIHCAYCKKDLCEECVGYEDENWGNYRRGYCKRCWDLGKEYRPWIEKLHEEIEDLYKEWQEKCKNE